MNLIETRRAHLSPAKLALLERRLRSGRQDAASGAATPAMPRIIPQPDAWLDPFPLTEIQQAYWIGRRPEFELGNVAMHVYFELDTDLELERLERAWNQLIGRHAMLRSVVLADGRMQTLAQPPAYRIEVTDLRGSGPDHSQAALEALRGELSHQVLPSDRWPLFDFRAARLDGQRLRLLLSIDGLIADATSLIVVLREWSELYRDPAAVLPRLDLAFRDCVLAEAALQETDTYRESLDFWKKRLETLPPGPELPLAKQPAEIRWPVFIRRSERLNREDFAGLKSRIAEAGLTPSAVLLAAFAEVLRQWCASPEFTLNVTVFNRLPLHPQIDGIVGDFTSLIPVAIEGRGEEEFLQRVRRVQAELLQGLSHRQVSGVRVLREYAHLHGGGAGGPMAVVFTSNLTLGGSGEDTFPFANIGKLVYGINQTPQVWLDHQVMEEGGALVFHWDAVDELFPAGLIDDAFGAYCRFLGGLARDGGVWRRPAPPLLPERQQRQRAQVNATERDIPDKTLWEVFLESAGRWRDRSALLAVDRTFTYGELAAMAQAIGRRLQDSGVRPDSAVGVVMEKGWEQVAAVLGTLAAGGAYLPIDPDTPPERLHWLLDDGRVELVLTQRRIDDRLVWPRGVVRIAVDSANWEESAPLSPAASPHYLAYVLYTSGSTGAPKGVMIEHRGVVNRIHDVNQRFHITPHDRVIALSALQHDLSVFDIFGTLAAGAELVIPRPDLSRDPAHWVDLMKAHGVTIWNSVPAFLEMLVAYLEHSRERGNQAPDSLREVLLAGDWIPTSLPDRLRALLPGARVTSLGGPTETTVWDICYPFETVEPGWKSIPYGRPMANASYHALDEELRPRPDWVPGELFIGGAGLARGYWRDEALTCERFFRHPATGERLYRSGDIGRYLPGGDIEFLGRRDFQVKIQGHRVELGEVEAALRQHPGVRGCAVAACGERTSLHLVAYVVGLAADNPGAGELRSFLEAKLPGHMVPGVFVPLDALPLTRNGKLDRRALPAPQAGRKVAPAATAAGGPVEQRIAVLAARVLGLAAVHPLDDFFSLGATSIEIVKLASLLEQEFGDRPAINQLVRLNSVAAIAAYYAGRAPAPPRAEAAIASPAVLLDPKARDDFKHRQLGIRRFPGAHTPLPLCGVELNEETLRPYRERRTTRAFAGRQVTAGEFGAFLAGLRQISLAGAPKYRWASGGGLYPVQVYLHVQPDRVDPVPAGTYYYHPVRHELFLLQAGARIERDIHFWNNQATADTAAFSIFLVADRRAIEPMYGEQALQFCLIEAGIIAHLLESTAAPHRIGLCQAANVDFEAIRHLFDLSEAHLYLHALLAGPLPEAAPVLPAGAGEMWEEGDL